MIIKTSLNKTILATVTLQASKKWVVTGGSGPVFMARDAGEQQRIAKYLSRITEGVVHDLENGILIIVRH